MVKILFVIVILVPETVKWASNSACSIEWSDVSQRKWDVRHRLRAARHKLSLFLQMGRKLWGQKPIGEDTPSLAKCRKTKQKVGQWSVVCMSVVVVNLPNADC